MEADFLLGLAGGIFFVLALGWAAYFIDTWTGPK